MTAGNSRDDGGAIGRDTTTATHAPVSDGAVERVMLSVVSGNPSEEELAALTAVVVALQGTQESDERTDRGRSWLRRAMLRLAPTPGPGSWRRSNR